MTAETTKASSASEKRVMELYSLAKSGRWGDVMNAMSEQRAIAVACCRYVDESTGWTFLHEAAYSGHGIAARALIGLGAAVGARGNDGRSPEEVALSRGEEGLAALLQRAKVGESWAASADESVLPTSYGAAKCEARRALLNVRFAYGGRIITIRAGSRYYVDEFERVLVGREGSYDPPHGI